MEELSATLTDPSAPGDPLVRAAMAHLNLMMIHPFRDGNGRMARALQTLVLSREAIVEPAFSSVEEWLGQNTDDYYRVLAFTGQGTWRPDHDARMWVTFNLRAHHMQAETVARRVDEAGVVWDTMDMLVAQSSLPERVTNLLYEAYLGYRLRRSSYVKSTGVDERTATRDLHRLVEAGFLLSHGATRARTYVAGPAIAELRDQVRRGRTALEDPYPWLPSALLQAVSSRPAPTPEQWWARLDDAQRAAYVEAAQAKRLTKDLWDDLALQGVPVSAWQTENNPFEYYFPIAFLQFVSAKARAEA
jgi:hypothetical protein